MVANKQTDVFTKPLISKNNSSIEHITLEDSFSVFKVGRITLVKHLGLREESEIADFCILFLTYTDDELG